MARFLESLCGISLLLMTGNSPGSACHPGGASRETRTAGFRWSYPRAAIHSYLNERDAVFDGLHQACEERTALSSTSGMIPILGDLRHDYRFKRILDRIGLQFD
jgi:hypothetical protein